MSLVDQGEKGPRAGWLAGVMSAVTCSSFHPNCAWSQGHDDIHHHSLPRSKTPAAPVGSVLMKPLPGTGDNPCLQTWSVFFVPEALHSHSAHFEHFPWTWPDLSWSYLSLRSYLSCWSYSCFLLVYPPLILEHTFLVVRQGLFPELTDRNAECTKPWSPPLEPQWVCPTEWGVPINDPFHPVPNALFLHSTDIALC